MFSLKVVIFATLAYHARYIFILNIVFKVEGFGTLACLGHSLITYVTLRLQFIFQYYFGAAMFTRPLNPSSKSGRGRPFSQHLRGDWFII
jgi:hypothetical protein